MKPLELFSGDAIHLSRAERVFPVPDFGHDYERYEKEYCVSGDPGRLIAVHESKTSWEAWEMHPAGDEVVVVLRGRARFIQEIEGQPCSVVVGPHEAVIIPAGVAHTADVVEPFIALYITACTGTTHRSRSAP